MAAEGLRAMGTNGVLGMPPDMQVPPSPTLSDRRSCASAESLFLRRCASSTTK
jgi:hypothetical protein